MTAKPHRIGHPSPLMFHLGAAAAGYLQGTLGAANAAEPAFPWHPALPPFEGPVPDPVLVARESAWRLRAMLDGIEKWQQHPFERPDLAPPAIWSDGTTRLLDYGQVPEATDPTGPVVVVVPSLINRAYILDLLPQLSALRFLAAGGLRPLLVDWGVPGVAEVGFDIDSYLDRRLRPALAIAQVIGQRVPALLGYCMGGTLAAGAVLSGSQVSALVTIGAPWDFHASGGLPAALQGAARQAGSGTLRASLRSVANAFGVVPVPVFQQLFALVDPMQAARKFRRFAALDPDGQAAKCFVALEDWLADGVPMTGPAAIDLLVDWHLENTPGQGRWPGIGRPGPTPPTLILSGRKDTIAQPAVAAGLVRAFPNAQLQTPALGHVGMITGHASEAEVWEPVLKFLTNLK